MIRDFRVNIRNLTGGVNEQGFGLVLIFDRTKDIPYTLFNSLKQLTDTPLSLTVDDKAYKIAEKLMLQNPRLAQIAIYGKEGGDTTALDELVDAGNGDFFSIVATENTTEKVEALGKWATINDKIYYTTLQDLTAFATLDIKNLVAGYHETETDLLAEGLAAIMAVNEPGSIIPKFKTVEGSKPSNIGLTELTKLHEENGFSYKRNLGINYVTGSKTMNGEYLDIVLGGYFIKFRIEEALFSLATRTGKIGYDDEGISSMVAEVRTVLNLAAQMGIILIENETPVYDIEVLSRRDVPRNDVANRVYNGIKVTATVAGAIESGEINIDLVI